MTEKYNAYNYQEYIEKLEEEIARLREAARWIPVEERLPEKDGAYIVNMNTANGVLRLTGMFQDGAWWPYFRRTDITHWMPMPEAPEVIE